MTCTPCYKQFYRDSSYFVHCRPDPDDNRRTHSEIRHEKLRELQEQRPTLTDKEIDILLETWEIIQENMDKVGTDMFVR